MGTRLLIGQPRTGGLLAFTTLQAACFSKAPSTGSPAVEDLDSSTVDARGSVRIEDLESSLGGREEAWTIRGALYVEQPADGLERWVGDFDGFELDSSSWWLPTLVLSSEPMSCEALQARVHRQTETRGS